MAKEEVILSRWSLGAAITGVFLAAIALAYIIWFNHYCRIPKNDDIELGNLNDQ